MRYTVDEITGCWNWKHNNKGLNGYGSVFFMGRLHRAHRISYILFHGPIKKGMLICHRCDNPSCINPAHLFQGTPKDNTQDALKKGRLVWNTIKPIIVKRDGEVIYRFKGSLEASKVTGHNQKSIQRACVGAIKVYKGFTWSYEKSKAKKP